MTFELWDEYGFTRDVTTGFLTCPDCFAMVSAGYTDGTPRWSLHYEGHRTQENDWSVVIDILGSLSPEAVQNAVERAIRSAQPLYRSVT